MKELFELLTQWAELAPSECQRGGEDWVMIEAEAMGAMGWTSIEIYQDSSEKEESPPLLYIAQYFIAKRGWLFNLAYAGDRRYWAKIWVTPEASPRPFYSDNPTVAILSAYVDALKGS